MILTQSGCNLSIKGNRIASGTMCPKVGLYKLDAEVVPGAALVVSTRRTLQEWHKTLGHADLKAVEAMAKRNLVDGMVLIDGSCTDCPRGKGTRAPHTTLTSTDPGQVGDQVVADLIGPMPTESLGKARYLLTSVDRFSGFVWVAPVATKDEVCEKLQHYVGWFEAQSGRTFLTDNGSEFANSRVRTLMDVEHINLMFSAPYTPEQNGAAERCNRTILEAIITSLSHSGLPHSLWAEAAGAAAYFRNLISEQNAAVTPFEMFTGRKPFVGHLVKFGTPVQVLISDRARGKLDPKAEPAFVVGFTDKVDTYRVFNPCTEKVKISCDVIFRVGWVYGTK